MIGKKNVNRVNKVIFLNLTIELLQLVNLTGKVRLGWQTTLACYGLLEGLVDRGALHHVLGAEVGEMDAL